MAPTGFEAPGVPTMFFAHLDLANDGQAAWTYLLHLKPAYKQAGHYLGHPESSAFLKVGCWADDRELAELKGSAQGAGWSGQLQAGAVQRLLDEPQCLREVLRVGLGGPAEDAQAVLELVEGEPLGRAGVQLAVFEVADQERLEDSRVQAVVGG
jgi:hypothetical protein